MIKITSKKDGFRRGGVPHPSTPTTYPDGFFTPQQLEQIQSEEMLVVEILPNPKEKEEDPDPEGEGKGKGKGKKEKD